MTYDPKMHHRKSIRLKGYDYSQAGLYFVTIVTQNRECLFGEIVDGDMVLNDAGRHIQKCWFEIPEHFSNVKLHEMAVMPNHFHGIIEIVGANNHSPDNTNQSNGAKNVSPLRSPSKTIGSVVRGFKIGVTKWFRENQKKQFPIGQSVWQRNYWEHIIRNENEYQRIAQYIINNPLKWETDKLNAGVGNQVMESPAMYGQNIFCPNDEAWMI